MYADDTQMYLSAPPQGATALMAAMEGGIGDVRDWMLANKLKMNDSKTEVLIFNPKSYNIFIDDTISINGKQIVCSEKARNLGVIFCNNLSMEHHVRHLRK